jgi:hypothetical protein
MSSTTSRWTELTDQNERFVRPGEASTDSTDAACTTARAQWAELASQRERLADNSDPSFGLASSRHATSGMRLVAGAA